MNVIVGIDGSELSFDALGEALTRASETGDDLTVAVLDRADSDRSPADIEQQVRDRIAETGIDATVRHLSGQPGPELVALADSEDVDRLVVPGGDRTPLGKIRLGEPVEFALLNAETTVTLVR